MIPVRNHILVEGFVNDDTSFLFDTGTGITAFKPKSKVSCTWQMLDSSARNPANYSSAIMVEGSVYYFNGYRYNSPAHDVMKVPFFSFPQLTAKVSLSPILEFVDTGRVPLFCTPSSLEAGMVAEEKVEKGYEGRGNELLRA
jgi:hypothetical protein